MINLFLIFNIYAPPFPGDISPSIHDEMNRSFNGDDCTCEMAVRIVRIKNRFLEPTPGGFRDVNMNLQLQISPESEFGIHHPLY